MTKLHPQEYAKAIVGALIAGLSVLAGAVGDGVSAEEWITTAIATLVAFGAIFRVENKPPRGGRRKANVSEMEPDAGHLGVETVVTVAIAVSVILVLLAIFGVPNANAGITWK